MIDGACPVCGASVDPGQRECDRCGFKLVGNTESFAPVVVQTGQVVQGAPTNVEGMALVVVKGPQIGAVFYVDRPSLSIGRDPNCDIFLSDMTVSRKHAIVTLDAGTVYIRDLGSLNGTWVDGELIESAALKEGSLVQIGIFSMTLKRESEA